MVLSLRELSLISIRDGIENGIIKNLNNLPTKFRQSILNYVLMHGTINEPACVDVLGSPEFFDGMTSLDFQQGRESDRKYLQHVADTLAVSTNGDETIGDRFTDLRLNLYKTGSKQFSNFREVVQIISRCRKLSILYLSIRDNRFYNELDPIDYMAFGLLNEDPIFESCLPVLENIDELSIILDDCCDVIYLINSRSIIKFKKLTSLTLNSADICGKVDPDTWCTFLENIQGTLKHLKINILKRSAPLLKISDLPCPLPELETLSIENFACLEGSINSFHQCPKLKEAYFEINAHHSHNYWPALNELNVNLKIKLNIDLEFGIDKMCDDEFRLVSVNIFKDKIIKVDIFLRAESDPRWQIALHHLLQECKKLEMVNIFYASCMKEIFEIFASDPNHALKVQTISIQGDFIRLWPLKPILAKFLNLKKFEVYRCDDNFDDLLIDWALNGVLLEELKIYNCKEVTDNGLISIIMSSGGNLKEIDLHDNEKISDKMWKMLFEHCRYVEKAFGCLDNLRGALLAKCFYGYVQFW